MSSGFDPLAAFALQAVANAQAALEESTLNLGALLTEFQAKLTVGDILSATVLPPQNGNDRLSLLGQTIDAQLPPGINPGETIALQVTGFTNAAVLVRNLGPVDGDVQASPVERDPSSDAPQSAVLRAAPPPPAQQQQPQQQTRTIPVAPPKELFVAASVRARIAQAAAAPAQTASPEDGNIEARIAAARASTNIGTAPIKPQPAPAQSAPAQSAPPQVRATAPSVQTQAPQAPKSPEAALLERLRVPLTPTTLAAARIADRATRSVTAAYETLDRLLAKMAPDERTASLRSTLAFVAKFDLRNVRALPEQIAAYVSNVVTGPESKIAQIVRAWQDSAGETAPEERGVGEPPSPPVQGPADASPVVAMRAAERTVALNSDVKTMLLQLIAKPPESASPQVVQALRDALTSTTAVQLNALTPQNNDTSSITIPLPAYFYDGGAPAQLRISRDAPNAKNPLDADNFHIAFVLDTKSLGTVAIDVQTVGRSVSVDVKTETARSADRFRTSLGDLRGRLENLQYRVATIAAGTAPRKVAPQTRATDRRDLPGRASNVDMQA